MANKKKVSRVQLAAKIFGCQVEELLSYREYEDGSVVIIAPSGQKFAYSGEALLAELARQAPAQTAGQVAGDKEGHSQDPGQSSLFHHENGEQTETIPPETGTDPGTKKSRKQSATGKSSG